MMESSVTSIEDPRKELVFDWRPYLSSDYELVCGWWKAHGWPIMGQELLPKTGVIIEHEGKPVSAGFLYKSSDSAFCYMEFIVSDPSSHPLVRGRSLTVLIEKICEIAKNNGFKVIWTALNHKRLIERVKQLGFQVGDTNMTHLVKGLQ